jgi:hypothetical protein
MPELSDAARIRQWREHPAQMVRELFHVEPDLWQTEVLEAFPHNPRIAMMACKGPGKTAVLAWLAWNFLLCYLNPKIAAVSITARNLKDNLWTEMSKWRAKAPLLSLFEVTSERIFLKEQPETWWMSARSWPQTADPQALADTLAGLWADNIMILMDEAGSIPPAVLATAQVIVANAGQSGKHAHVVIAGNTTSHTGALYDAAVAHRASWHVTEITADPDDPKRTPRIPIEFAREQIREYGRDNPWIMVNFLAKFPKQGLNTLISADEVITAQKRNYHEQAYAGFPKILGVDVAQFGDDESVMFKRQGKISWNPLRMRNLSPLQGGPHVARIATEWQADSIQIDNSGGWGGAWFEFLTTSGYDYARGVKFGGGAAQEGRFANKRAEIYWEMCDWIKDGGLLPPIPEMVSGLSSMTYGYDNKGRVLVEEKKQIKVRLGRSPDLEDALACTFAYPVAPRAQALPGMGGLPPSLSQMVVQSVNHDYNPWDRFDKPASL